MPAKLNDSVHPQSTLTAAGPTHRIGRMTADMSAWCKTPSIHQATSSCLMLRQKGAQFQHWNIRPARRSKNAACFDLGDLCHPAGKAASVRPAPCRRRAGHLERAPAPGCRLEGYFLYACSKSHDRQLGIAAQRSGSIGLVEQAKGGTPFPNAL